MKNMLKKTNGREERKEEKMELKYRKQTKFVKSNAVA